MKMKTLLPLTALVLCGLVGCGPSGGGDTPSGKTKIYVHSSYGKGLQERLSAYADLFMAQEENKDIEVIVEQKGSGYEGLRKLVVADLEANNDTWGDLVQCYPDHVQAYKKTYKKAVNVDEFINSSDPSIALSPEELADYTDAAKENLNTEFTFSGKFVLPYSASTEALYYNPVLLNLTIPGVNGGKQITREYMNSLTWEELFDNLCPKLIEYNAGLPTDQQFFNTSGSKYAVVGYDSDDNAFITLAEQYGYGYTTLDEDKVPHLMFDKSSAETGYNDHAQDMEDLCRKWSSYYDKHYLITKASNGDSYCSSMLADNSLLMNIGSTGGITYLYTGIGGKFDAEVARLPQAAGKDVKLINQGGSWCILSHNSSNNKARQLAAWKFYKFISSPDMSTAWSADTGYAPIKTSVYSTEEWAELIDETDKTDDELLKARNAKYAGKVQENLFVNKVFTGSSSSRNYVGGLFGEILMMTNPSASDVASKFATAINNIRNDM